MPQQIDDNHPVCRFPSRYYWLNSQIALPNYKTTHPQCKNLNKAMQSVDIESYSLIFVDGYLGNPASAFGHSFLKTNLANTHTDLFDISIGYAAKVPDNENPLLYIFKGLSGGYDAQFSDQYYYTNDIVYSQKELRDMWEYRLNLSEEQKIFLSLHIYEVVRHKFQYFFLNKNCGYEISKLLAIILEEPLVDNARIWFSPIETFHKLSEINQKKDNSLIQKVTFHPSTQKLLYKEYATLTTHEKDISKFIINQDIDYKSKEYKKLSTQEQINVSSFLLSYTQYSLAKDTNEKVSLLKQETILQRLRLPQASRKNLIKKDNVFTPEMGNTPFSTTTMLNYNQEQGFYPSLAFTPFSIESTGQNHLNADEFSILNTHIALLHSKNKFFIDKFDLIKIKKFKLEEMPFEAESNLSWDFHMGLERLNTLEYSYFSQFSLGKSYQVTNNILFFTLAELALYSNQAMLRVLPKTGMRIDSKKLKGLFYLGYENNFEGYKPNLYIKTDISYSINKDMSLKLDYIKRDETKVTLGLKFFI